MANKLYEENSISDIADAIRQINGKTNSYTVAQMGDAIRKVRKVYKGTVTETVIGSTIDSYVVLAKDDFLKENRSKPNLFVRVVFDIEPTPYTIVRNWSFGAPWALLPSDQTQYIYRYGANAAASSRVSVCKFTDETCGLGDVLITEDGELRIHPFSSNYAIRPSDYIVIVEC